MRGRIRLAVGALALVVAGIPAGAATAAAASPVPPDGMKATAEPENPCSDRPKPEKPGPDKPKPEQPKPKEPAAEESKQDESKPGRPATTEDQLRKKKRQAIEAGQHKACVDLAALADKLGVSEKQLDIALTHAKKSTPDPGHLSRATVRAFARELGISRRQARKVLMVVFQAPAQKG